MEHHVSVIPTIVVPLNAMIGEPPLESLLADDRLRPFIDVLALHPWPNGPELNHRRRGMSEAMGRMIAARVPILAGTDAVPPITGIPWEASLHRELELPVEGDRRLRKRWPLRRRRPPGRSDRRTEVTPGPARPARRPAAGGGRPSDEDRCDPRHQRRLEGRSARPRDRGALARTQGDRGAPSSILPLDGSGPSKKSDVSPGCRTSGARGQLQGGTEPARYPQGGSLTRSSWKRCERPQPVRGPSGPARRSCPPRGSLWRAIGCLPASS